MTKTTRVLTTALGAVALSLLFVSAAFAAKPEDAVAVDKTTSAASFTGTSAAVTYTYKVSNEGTGFFMAVSVNDDKCAVDDATFTGDDGDGKLEEGETWTYSCTATLTATTTNTVTVNACHDGSKDECNNLNHNAGATDSATVTKVVPTAAPTLAPTAKPATATELPSGGNSGGAAMLALILLAIGGIGFLGTTNRLPKLPKFR